LSTGKLLLTYRFLFLFLPVVKKLLAIAVLALFLFNTMGYFFVFRINQSYIRNEVKEIIKSGNLKANYTLLKIANPASNPDFKKTETDEFVYFGRMYDVVSERSKGDTTYFYCINDKQEEELIAGFQSIQKYSPGTGSSEKARHTYALLYHVITIALVDDPAVSVPKQPATFKFCEFEDQHSSTYQPPVSPPPKA
jgi:hypothetical protein